MRFSKKEPIYISFEFSCSHTLDIAYLHERPDMSTSYVNPGWSVNESDCRNDYSAKPKNNLFDVLLNVIKLILKALIGVATMVPITYVWCLLADDYPKIPFCVFAIPILLSSIVITTLLIFDATSKFNLGIFRQYERIGRGYCEILPWICFAPFGVMVSLSAYDAFCSGNENAWTNFVSLVVTFLPPILATVKWRKSKPYLYACIVLVVGPLSIALTVAAILLLITIAALVVAKLIFKLVFSPFGYVVYRSI